MREVNSHRAKANVLFHRQKRHAKLRGLSFEFSFDEWVNWWLEHLGPDWMEKRGVRRDNYVMARIGDLGGYSISNVKCVTSSENQSEQYANGSSGAGWNKGKIGCKKKGVKLSDKNVIDIFHSKETISEIAKRYGVHHSVPSRIRNKKAFLFLVKDLERDES